LGVPVKSFANSVQVTLNTVAHPVNAIRDCPAVRLLQRRELAERLHGTVGGHLRCKRKLLTKVAACPRSFLAALTEFFSQILCRFALHQTRNASGEPKRQRERQSANKQQAKSGERHSTSSLLKHSQWHFRFLEVLVPYRLVMRRTSRSESRFGGLWSHIDRLFCFKRVGQRAAARRHQAHGAAAQPRKIESPSRR